ncbi:hypothetical protein K7X08_015211 [Anisodus acutangulus]|uniref:Pentatricopeptide repeat-containing protein n=1 Tax=Anisodus acutangulus TaxID=402998 RepID=A0A9Q1QUN8_9SOLA|nr:hypothetical protein K7X08_015211 [Anisodus acutangulus]
MLTAYSQNKQLKKARQLFDEMPERSVPSWNAMLTGYMRNRVQIDEIFKFFEMMPERNSVSFAAMITGFVNAGRVDMAENLYNRTPVVFREPVCSNVLINGYLNVGKFDNAVRVFDGMVKKDIVSCSAMIDGYSKNGRVIEARELFDKMKERNEVTWGAMIDGYMKACSFVEGFDLFLRIRRGSDVRLEPTILTIVLEACGRFSKRQQGYQVHGLVSRLGFEFDVFLGNSLITMYSRFGCVDAAKSVFESMLMKDVISWNSLISAFVQAGKLEEGYELFKQAPEKDVVSWTAMITGFSENGLTEKCVDLFKMIPEKDDVAWTALISSFVNKGEYEEAFRWFIEMLRGGLRPNPLTLSSMLSASAGMAMLNQDSICMTLVSFRKTKNTLLTIISASLQPHIHYHSNHLYLQLTCRYTATTVTSSVTLLSKAAVAATVADAPEITILPSLVALLLGLSPFSTMLMCL